MRNFVKTMIVSAMLLLWLTTSAAAQDNVRYRVHIAPHMEIRALGQARSATHPMTAANLTFNNQQWHAVTLSGTGSTVRFTTDHAFRHATDFSYKRDARLQLTRIVGTSSARWQFDTVTDTTNYAAGDETATVQISSRGPGVANISMNVIFMTGSLASLKGGQYDMTVVGTISEN